MVGHTSTSAGSALASEVGHTWKAQVALPPGLAKPRLVFHCPIEGHCVGSAPMESGPAVLLGESPTHHLPLSPQTGFRAQGRCLLSAQHTVLKAGLASCSPPSSSPQSSRGYCDHSSSQVCGSTAQGNKWRVAVPTQKAE